MRDRRPVWVVLAVLALITGACSRSAGEASSGDPLPMPTAVPAAATPGEAATTATGGGESETETVRASPSAPNIVVFMTDDQNLNEMIAMPRVQRQIFDEGMTFTQSFVNLPSCCPSRATFLTGQHAGNHGVLTNSGATGGFGAFQNQDATLPTALVDVGYETLFVGKYLNGFGLTDDVRYTPPGWTDFRGLVSPTEVLYHSPSFWIDDEVVSYGENDYTTDLIHAMSLEAIAEAARTGRPFFATVSYPAPHAQAGAPFIGGRLADIIESVSQFDGDPFLRPPIPARSDAGTYSGAPIPANPSFNEADVSDKPDVLERKQRDGFELAAVQAFHEATLESLVAVDRSVAELLAQIDRVSPDRETWIIFTSDNGLLLGEHRHFGTKYLPYEESIRVPLAIKGPGIEAGSRMNAVVSNVDLMPTIIDIAEASYPRDPDGRSLLPLLVGDEEPGGRAILLEGYEFRPASPQYKGVHTGTSVYIEWATGEVELYDLRVDPFQLNNLAGSIFSGERLARHQALLAELVACAGEACAQVGSELPLPEDPAVYRQ